MTNIVIAYDKRMTYHRAPGLEPDSVPRNEDEPGFQYENPFRIKSIFDRLQLLNKTHSAAN